MKAGLQDKIDCFNRYRLDYLIREVYPNKGYTFLNLLMLFDVSERFII